MLYVFFLHLQDILALPSISFNMSSQMGTFNLLLNTEGGEFSMKWTRND